MVPWIQTLVDPEEHSAGLNGLAGEWAKHDPVAAMEWATKLESSHARDDAIALIVDRWSAIDPEGAGDGFSRVWIR